MIPRGWTRAICLVLVLALAPMAITGCIGSFAAWHKVKDWNTGMNENKWIQELMFLVLHIVPVYPIAYLLDILIINSIEFWTGDNPMMDQPSARTVVGEDGSVATITPVDENRLDVTIVTPDGTEKSFQLERVEKSISAYDSEGRLMVRAEKDGAENKVTYGQ